MRDEPLISVVTPVYNGEAYLVECIESVLAQTYRHWEYMILDNCSTDGTLKIAEQYATQDSRIRVYRNDVFLNIIANHNKLFRLISPDSKYCKQVSADDWLFPECIAQLVRAAEANPSVGIVGSYQLSGSGADGRGWRVRCAELPYPSTVISGHEICRSHLLGGPYVFGSPSSVLYRADLMRGQESFYPNSTAHADISACYKYLKNSDFGFVHQVLSYERIHEAATSAECRRLNTHVSSKLSDLLEYGPSYLTAGELEGRVEEVLREYYEYLAVRLFHRKDKGFWNYHKKRLNECSHPFSYMRFANAVSVKALDLLLNPKQTLEKLVRISCTSSAKEIGRL